MDAMSDVKTPTKPAPVYERDYFAWSQDQAARIRSAKPTGVDWENVAEEIESLGRSDKRAIESDLNVVLVHLLKWAFQPDERKRGWRSSIVEHRHRIAKRVKESPSLKGYPAEILAEEYRYARTTAADETGLSETASPANSPFTIAQVLDPDFYPEPKRG
jgi:hypothetical protein